jgi:uncharacterized protein (DUF58 family)
MFTVLQQYVRQRIDRWLFRLPDVEPGEVFLKQRRVFIIPTSAGLAFGLMLVVLFIGSVNYNLSLGFALTFLLAACAVVAMHLTFRNLAHLHLAAGRAAPVFAGEPAGFALHLINRRRHDRFAIWIGFADAAQQAPAQAVDVPAAATRVATLSAPSVERGWLAAPRVRLQTRFPLGLLRAWSYWQPDAQALIYPQPEADAPPLPMTGGAAEMGRGRGGEDDFAGIRAYQQGDPIKHLAWRQIARLDTESGGQLLTKHFDGSAACELCLDFARLPRIMDLELKLSRMTRWVLEAEAAGLAYRFRLGSTELAAANGAAHRNACLQALALYQEP